MTRENTQPIGVFDSGVGGLTVVQELLGQLPGESLIYYADTAHVPYGPREPEELKAFARNITAFLVEQGCKLIIVACNTSTSLAYEELVRSLPIPLVGVIEPGVNKALETTVNNRIGVIATQATIKSRSYEKQIRGKRPGAEVTAVPCPLFVPLVEKGQLDGEQVEEAAREYLRPIQENGVDSLILGCTHYPFLIPVISRVLGPSIQLIDPARETVSRTALLLNNMDFLNSAGPPLRRFYASGDPQGFRLMGSSFLKQDIGPVSRVSLD